MRPGNGLCAGWAMRYQDYFLFNEVGARLYHMSKGKICNREPKGHERYCTPDQLKYHESLMSAHKIESHVQN